MQKVCHTRKTRLHFSVLLNVKTIGYWSQAKDGRFSSAQTLPRPPTNSTVSLCNSCLSREVSIPEPFNLRHFLFLILHYFYCVLRALRKTA